MKTKFFVLFILFGSTVYSQSVLTLDAGTSMGVLNGTDLCANIINPTGLLYGGGTICGNLVSLEPVAGNEIPREFVLMQNYPNPFNPMTKLKFSIPLLRGVAGEAGRGVLLKVYDVLGKEIAVLVNENLKPGIYEIEWDASNIRSVYFYSLITNDFTQTKKMVVLK